MVVGFSGILLLALLYLPFAVALPFLSVGVLLYVIISPVFLIAGLFSVALLNHLFLLIVSGAPKGFPATLRALAYASSPNIIPYVGVLWSLVLMIFALAYAHQTEIWRPVVASLLESLVFGVVLGIPLFFLAAILLRHLGNPF